MRTKFFTLIIASCLLSSCGNASVIALGRGKLYETNAKSDSREGWVSPEARKDYLSAIDQYSAAIKIDKHCAEAYQRRAACERQLEQWDAVNKDLSEAIALNPNNEIFWQQRASAYEAEGEADPAVSDYKRCLALLPDTPAKKSSRASIQASIAYCETTAGNLTDALTDANAAIAAAPTPHAYCQRAHVHRALHQIPEMREDYQQAIKLAPHRAQNYQSRAYNELVLGDYQNAVNDFQKAMNLQSPAEDDMTYCTILGGFAARLNKDETKAHQLLAKGMTAQNIETKQMVTGQLGDRYASAQQDEIVSPRWPRPIVQFMHGDISRQKVEAAAGTNKNRLTEANCYLGLDSLLQGEKDEARRRLETVVRNGNRSFVEYDIAKFQLAHMNHRDANGDNLIKPRSSPDGAARGFQHLSHSDFGN